MEILDVSSSAKMVYVGDPLRILFKVIGAEAAGFEFPFSNESLIENKIQFISEASADRTSTEAKKPSKG